MDFAFLINTLTKWDEPPRARHQVAYALAKKHPVVFVSANRIGFPRFKKNQVSDNLIVIIPYFWMDYRIRIRIPMVNSIYQKWLFSRLRKTYQKVSVINFDFTARYLSKYFASNIYYCNDDHVGMSYKNRPRWIADYHNICEQEIAKNSKFCIATSGFLLEKLKKLNANSFEIRLGAPVVKHDQISSKKQNKDADLINVGFVGYYDTADLEIMGSLISKADLFLTIVGPMSKKAMTKIMNLRNVRMTGNLTGQQLFDEVSKFDVGLIPYDLKSEIDRTPNKLWLYLSLGKPTVVSNVKGIINWEFPDKFVYRANDIAEFHDLIKKSCVEDDESLAKQRIEFAENNSWDKRIEDFLSIYDKII